jgi:hypothetical protein
MGQRDDLEMVIEFAIDQKKGEVAETKAADRLAHTQPLDYLANFRVPGDQTDCGLNFEPEPVTETSDSALIPANGLAKFTFRSGTGSNRLRHR